GLGVDYPYGITSHSLRIDRLEAGGGFALGGNWENFTNVAYLPEGRGGLLDFVAPSTDPIRLSISIDNLWQSGVLARHSAPHLASTTAYVTAGGAATARFWFPPDAPGFRSCVFVSQS